MLAWLALFAAAEQEPFEPKYRPIVLDSLKSAVHTVLEDLPQIHAGKILIIPLDGNISALATEEFAHRIEVSARFQKVEQGKFDKILEWLGVKKELKEIQTAADARAAAKKAGADYALFGRVFLDPRELPGKCILDVRCRIVSADGHGVHIGTYKTEESFSAIGTTRFRIWMNDRSAIWRILIWLMVAGLLPLVALLLRESLAESRPVVPALLLALLTLVDLLFAWFLMGLDIDGIFQAVLFLLAIGISVVWNLFFMRRFAQAT
jgi:hypothetical protein